mmetsp:Transcript_144497/g.402575  ORF Transcript_144497/g.402575 Transcript_144497/m.402575 type:complete len:283 (+) Transcript_144497:485-1333(+)
MVGKANFLHRFLARRQSCCVRRSWRRRRRRFTSPSRSTTATKSSQTCTWAGFRRSLTRRALWSRASVLSVAASVSWNSRQATSAGTSSITALTWRTWAGSLSRRTFQRRHGSSTRGSPWSSRCWCTAVPGSPGARPSSWLTSWPTRGTRSTRPSSSSAATGQWLPRTWASWRSSQTLRKRSGRLSRPSISTSTRAGTPHRSALLCRTSGLTDRRHCGDAPPSPPVASGRWPRTRATRCKQCAGARIVRSCSLALFATWQARAQPHAEHARSSRTRGGPFTLA